MRHFSHAACIALIGIVVSMSGCGEGHHSGSSTPPVAASPGPETVPPQSPATPSSPSSSEKPPPISGSGEVLNRFAFSPNPRDSLILRATNSNKKLFDVFGTKAENGLPIAVTSFGFPNQTTGGVDQVLLNPASGMPNRVVSDNGVDLRFEFLDDTKLLVSAVVANAGVQANVVVDLTNPPASAPSPTDGPLQIAPSSIISLQTPAVSNLAARGGAATSCLSLPTAINSTSALPKSSITAGVDAVAVTVARCGQAVNDAVVSVRVLPEGGSVEDFPAAFAGAGVYVANIPTMSSSSGQAAEETCSIMAKALGISCKLTEALGPSGAFAVCTAIAGAVGASGAGAVVAPEVLAVCETAFINIALLCNTVGFDPDPGLGDSSIADLLCSTVSATVDRFFVDDVLLDAVAFIDAQPFFPATVERAPGTGPFPSFEIDAGGEPKVTSFTTDPVDPGPFQGYTATAQLNCFPEGGKATLSIVGTDGYTDSSTCLVPGDGRCQLFVPGAEGGIMDTVTVSGPDGVNRTVVLVF